MTNQLPNILLFTEPSNSTLEMRKIGAFWKFRMIDEFGKTTLAADGEESGSVERLALLAVVRGLEALDGPSNVTLVNPHRYISRGLNYGLSTWRAQHWRWERFGQMVEIRNADLWQRVDRTMQFHRLSWRHIRIDSAHGRMKRPNFLKRRVVQHVNREYQVA